MPLYKRPKSPLGYQLFENQIDSYGVDHSLFSTRDEIEYQLARAERENSLMQNSNSIDSSGSYTQYGTNFWGTSSDNNYGFGSENISENIENLKNDPNCYMTFDGQNLNLYNNGLVDSLDAQSGHDDFQSSIYQSVKNKGPLPEGTYYANQDQRQNIDLADAAYGTGIGIANFFGANIDRGRWNGGPFSWGLKRVWLQPDEANQMYGRDKFSIHGGFNKGSAGCIDIPWQTDDLSDYLDNCQNSVPVYVKYPKKW